MNPIFVEQLDQAILRFHAKRCQRLELKFDVLPRSASLTQNEINFLAHRLQNDIPSGTPIDLDLDWCSIQPDAMPRMEEMLKRLPSLESLGLLGVMNYRNLARIARAAAFKKQNQVRFELPLARTIRGIYPVLRRLDQWKEVSFCCFPLHENEDQPQHIQELTRGLEYLKNVTKFSLATYAVETTSVAKLTGGVLTTLRPFPLLKEVSFALVSCDDAVLTILVDGLLAMPQLESVDITVGGLTRASLLDSARLLEGIPRHTKFLFLIRRCALFQGANPAHLDAFLNSMAKCQSPKSVFGFRDTGITPEVMCKLLDTAQRVEQDHTLIYAEGQNIMTDTAFRKLLSVLPRIRKLRGLSIKDRSLSATFPTTSENLLTAALKRNPSLEQFDMQIGTESRPRCLLDRVDCHRFYLRNASLRVAHRFIADTATIDYPLGLLPRALGRFHTQAPSYASDPLYLVLKHELGGRLGHHNGIIHGTTAVNTRQQGIIRKLLVPGVVGNPSNNSEVESSNNSQNTEQPAETRQSKRFREA